MITTSSSASAARITRRMLESQRPMKHKSYHLNHSPLLHLSHTRKKWRSTHLAGHLVPRNQASLGAEPSKC